MLSAIKEDYKDKIVVFISHRNYNTYLFNKIIKIKDKKGRTIYDKTKTKRIKKIKGRRFKWLGNRWYYSRRISELKKIKAGATFSASLINALVRGINSFLDVGRYFGSSIRRFIGGNSCPLK